MGRIIGCPICGSEKLYGKTCPACLDLTYEQWAVKEAQEAYVKDHITIEELETQLEIAFTNPPKRDHPHFVYR